MANEKFNKCANRCYYACFHAAIAAMLAVDIDARSARGHYRHQTVHALFIEQLINRRRRYPPVIRSVLSEAMLLRESADYQTNGVSAKQATRSLRRASEFVEEIRLVEERSS